jgi:hypothetical protein
MKGTIKRKNKLDLSKQTNNHKASFVSTESKNTKRFKYNFILRLSRYNNEKFIALENTCKKIKEMIQLRLNKFDFGAAGTATMIWLMNAFIEGLIVNFTVWGLLGWDFNFITIMAWGFAVKQSLDLYWRLKINGTTTKLPEKH